MKFLRDGKVADGGRAWILFGSRKNLKPEKCLKTAQNPTSRLRALLATVLFFR
jgi:hypothetical protein